MPKKKLKYDFSGYATKINIRCSDGRIIRKDAFKHHDGQRVPLVWQHQTESPENVLGYAILEHRDDGVYAYGCFNDTESGKNAKALVQHGDIESLSIYANKLKQKGSEVLHGMIRELSLVLSGANIGAMIDNVVLSHADGTITQSDEEAIIHIGSDVDPDAGEIDEPEEKEGELEHKDETVKEIFETLNEKQKNVVYEMIAKALEDDEGMKQSATTDDEGVDADDSKDTDDSTDASASDDSVEDKINHSEGGTTDMKKNVFDKTVDDKKDKMELTHSDMQAIFTNAKKLGSLKEAVLQHAGTYGIDDIDYLFPDARKLKPEPDMISREMSWVREFLNACAKVPFSRIKSTAADITVETARAKGYTTGNEKTEEVFGLLKRVTTPTTVYKKQKLDRDDIVDITDFNVVTWLKMEMRMMLDEEIARAILVSDGRAVISDDKISEDNIRPIYNDADMYAHKVQLDSDVTVQEKIEGIIRARKYYKGTGRPTMFTTSDNLTDMLLLKDSDGRRIYRSEAELVADLRVAKIVEVEVMEDVTRTDDEEAVWDLFAIIVNPSDYKIGADKGGKVATFDDFDIDYNQYKYLIEGRMSGCLVKPKSALVIEVAQEVE